MACTATMTYVSPKGRNMSRTVYAYDYASILKDAKKVANKPNYTKVKLFNAKGVLLASVRKAA